MANDQLHKWLGLLFIISQHLVPPNCCQVKQLFDPDGIRIFGMALEFKQIVLITLL